MTSRSIEVGRIAGLFGVRGELKCDPSNASRSVFSPGALLRCEREGVSKSVRLTAVRQHKNRLLLRIEGADDPAVAQSYVGCVLYAPRESVPLESGEYLDADLIGCAVTGPDGRSYGSVDRVEHFPSSDMLVVSGTLVPMVRAIVREIDLSGRRIIIDPPDGLFD